MLMGGRVYIPGSSRYVKNLPFCIILSGEKAQMLHIWKIQVYIYIDTDLQMFFSAKDFLFPDLSFTPQQPDTKRRP